MSTGRRPRSLILCLGALTAAVLAPGAPAAVAAPGERGPRGLSVFGQPVPTETRSRAAAGEVLIRFRAGTGAAARAAVLRTSGVEGGRAVRGTGFIRATTSVAPRAAAARLRRNPAVAAAEPNWIRTASAIPNDLLYREGFNQRPYLGLVRLPAAWDIVTGTSALRLAVVDTGVDLDNPDLAGRIVPGWDFVGDDEVPQDDDGHGTFVAGVAAAATNNDEGVAGVDWHAGVMPVKVLDSDGQGTDADVAAGITWAADYGADVINLALGGPEDGATLAAAIDYAVAHGALVVGAAGNDGAAQPTYPAAYPNVVGVSATDASGNFAAFSNYGPWVDIAAPGYEITSTFLASGAGHRYGYDSATSYSAALVAGIALLTRSHDPALSVHQTAERLRSTARDAGPRGRDPYYGHGLVDALGAVGGPVGSAFRSPAGDAREPDGTPARAKAITDPYFESGTISPQGDVDWYRLDGVSPGTIRFHIESSYAYPYAERMDPAGQVFGPDLTPVTAPQQTDGSALWIDAQAPVAGSYYLKVWNRLGARSRLTPGTPWGYTVKHDEGSWPLPLPDLPKPWVRDTAPADFSEGAPTGVAPTVVFAHDLDPATVTSAHLKLENGLTGELVPAAVSYVAGTRTATIQPAAALGSGTPYIVTVAGVTDTAGARMDEPLTFRFTVGTTPDTTPPDTTITFALTGGDQHETGFYFTANEPNSRFECSVDTGSWRACETPDKYAWIADGTHTYRVRARDAAGNLDPTPATRTWTMPPPNDNFASAHAISGSSGSLVAGSVGATMETGEPAHAGVGSRSIWYRWTAPSSGKLTLDTFGSEFPSVVALYTGSTVGSLTEVASGHDWHGSGWGRAVANVSAGTTYSVAVGGGPVANSGPGRGTAHLNWSLGAADTTAPDTSISAGPSGTVAARSASFAFGATEGGASFECSLDGAAFAACTPPRNYDGLADGAHGFSVRARDEVGNVDPSPATRSWSVDTTPPETTIDSGPSGTTTSTAATFSFSASESGAGFACSLDGGAFTGCSSPMSYDALPVGSHTFAVRATDPVGNADASTAAQSWWVAAPATEPAAPQEGAPPSNAPTPPDATPPAPQPGLTAPATPAGALPRNVEAPHVRGEARVGRTLLVEPGVWIGDGPLVFGVGWQRCDATASRCRDIGVSTSRYTLTKADAGHRMRVRVLVRNAVGSAEAALTSVTVRASRGVTRIRGSARADALRGTPGPDIIVGGAGNDVVIGGAGADRLVGGPGRDRLLGGRGPDMLVARDGHRDRLDGGPGSDGGSWDRLDRKRRMERAVARFGS